MRVKYIRVSTIEQNTDRQQMIASRPISTSVVGQ